MSGKSAPSPELRKVVDPIGEIEKLARALWTEAGSPSSTTWEAYWEAAEQRLTGAGSVLGSSRKRPSGTIVRITPAIEAMIAQREKPFLSILASAFLKQTDEHESICLGYLLQNYRFTLKDSVSGEISVVGILDTKDAASYVARISGFLPSDLVEEHGGGSIDAVPTTVREAYWLRRLVEVKQKDEALSYADQNTIMRLRDQIAAEPRVSQLEYVE